jgi:hypothetical protein
MRLLKLPLTNLRLSPKILLIKSNYLLVMKTMVEMARDGNMTKSSAIAKLASTALGGL